MAESNAETEDIVSKTKNMNIGPEKQNASFEEKSNESNGSERTKLQNPLASVTTKETDNSDKLAGPERPASENISDSTVLLKANLAQKSRTLSAKDKAKIAEMVRGLAKFKHAEEEMEPKKPKGMKDKGKKAKIKEVMHKDDEWEDVDSEEEMPEKDIKPDNIVIQPGDTRIASDQPKTQKSSKVGSYTKLLQTVGGRKPDMHTSSSPSLQSSPETVNQSEHTMSAKKRKSLQRAEAHHLKMQMLGAQQGTVRMSPHEGDLGTGAAIGGVKIPHKEQAKLRSEMYKQSLQNKLPSESETSRMQTIPVTGRMCYRAVDETLQAELKAKKALDGGLAKQEHGNQRVDTKGKKNKKKKKQEEEAVAQVSKVSPVPPSKKPVAALSPVQPAERVTTGISEVRIKVPKVDHKFIVGQSKKNLQEIHSLTGVTIEVPKANDESEEIVLIGDKFQIGTAVTLMYTKCEVSRAEFDQKQKVKEIIKTQMAEVREAAQQVRGQGQQRPGSGKVHKHQDGNLDIISGAHRDQGHLKGQRDVQPLSISEMLFQGHLQQPYGSQGQRGQSQRSDPLYQRPKSGQGQGQENQRWNIQGQGQYKQGGKKNDKGQGQNKNKGQQNKPKKIKVKHDKHVVFRPSFTQPLLYDSVWLHRGKYEAAEAHYQRVIAGTVGHQKSRSRRQNRTKVFEPYWPMEDVSIGLKRGVLIQGPIRINPKNFEEAYVPHPDGKSDILICSFIERNRALNGDIVAVLLKEEGDWKVHKEELQHLEAKHATLGTEDIDPDVTIESEEIIVTEEVESTVEDRENIQDGTDPAQSTKADDAKAENQAAGQGQNKGVKSPNKALQRYHNLNDVLTEGSPVAKRLFTSGGDEAEAEIYEEARKLLVRTGKVVAIIEKKHTRACCGTIRPLQDKNPYRALFAPSDYRLPRLLVPIDNCPKGLLERPEDFARILYVGRITEWKDDSKMAFGKVMRSLGEAGEIEPETEGMLIENGVDFDEFPQQALDCLPAHLPWSIPETELEYRRDFRESCIFTIDPSTARDLDDALSCEDLGNGRYKVGVHIADVSWFIEEGSILDRVAGLRATSVYLVHKVIPMLPRLLCEELCSLNPDEDRLTFSVEWTISESGEIEDEWFGRSVIRSCVKLSYDHAQGFIEQPDRDWTQEELPPISEGFTVGDIRTRVLNLHKIARNLRKNRFESGSLRLDQVKLQYSLDPETGMPDGYWVYQQKESNSLVEEFMLLANMAVAHRINRFFPDKAFLRRHPPPQEKMLENLKDQCEALGLHLDTSGAGQLQRSLWRYFDDDEYSLARMQVLVSLCSKPMQNAKYFCTGCIDDESLYHHYALNVPLYTHFTSPIRRYPDVIVHRMLGATLDYCEGPRKSPQDLQKLAEHCNDKKTAAKRCSDLSGELFFAVFVKVAGPLEEKAMVMAVFDKAFDIFILRLGVTKRVYCDKLDIKEKIYMKDKKIPSLTLVWNKEDDVDAPEDSSEIRQVIIIFSVVDCVLQQGELPLQWTAIIKRPVNTDFLQHFEIQAQEVTAENDMSDSEEIQDVQYDEINQRIDEQQSILSDVEPVSQKDITVEEGSQKHAAADKELSGSDDNGNKVNVENDSHEAPEKDMTKTSNQETLQCERAESEMKVGGQDEDFVHLETPNS